MSEWIEIGALDDIPKLGARIVKSPAGCIAVFRDKDDSVYALENKCPHKGGPLSEGIVHDGKVTCPLHNTIIALDSGEAVVEDFPAVKTFEVKAEAGRLLIKANVLQEAS